MIVATLENGRKVKVNRLANRGEWFGDTWLVTIAWCAWPFYIAVEGDHESAVVDALTDSEAGSIIRMDEAAIADAKADYGEEYWDEVCFAGNASEPIHIEMIHAIERCKLNYFAPATMEVEN